LIDKNEVPKPEDIKNEQQDVEITNLLKKKWRDFKGNSKSTSWTKKRRESKCWSKKRRKNKWTTKSWRKTKRTTNSWRKKKPEDVTTVQTSTEQTKIQEKIDEVKVNEIQPSKQEEKPKETTEIKKTWWENYYGS